MEETPFDVPAPSPLPKRKINKRFIYLVLSILLLAILFIGYKALNPNKQPVEETSSQSITTPTETSTPTPLETSTPTPSLTPTPKPTSNPIDKATKLDRSKLSIIVENGSGEDGVAGKASDYLKGLGYDVVSTDNADNYDYTNVTVQVKSSASDFLDLLKKDLGFNYTIDSATTDLPDSFSSDALVIIGK